MAAPARAHDPDRRLARQGWIYFAGLTALGLVITGGFIPFQRSASSSPAGAALASAAAVGTAMIDANRTATVTIDGVARGSTPLAISLPAGSHTMDIASGDASRSLPLIVESGTTIKQFVEFASPSADAAGAGGQLDIRSDPPGAQVKVDGAVRGVTPLKLSAIAPGEHDVILTKGTATIHQTVTIQRGAAASIDGVMTETASAGWGTFTAPVVLDILEDGQTVGTTSASRLMLPAGVHHFEFRNAAFEISTPLTVQVVAGKTTTVAVPVPNGRLSINATPWANVFIDGKDMGTTPLANLAVPAGRHEVIWRNPERGERRRSVDVTASSPVRVGMDFAQ